jgi:hypothetical protein
MARLARLLLVLLISVISLDRARADVDLTGSWNVTGSIGTFTEQVHQSGTALTLGRFVGTIDPVTGGFALESPPQPGGFLPLGFPYGPSPPDTINGTASSDGNTFDATLVSWIIKVTPPNSGPNFPWFPFEDRVHGVRRDLAHCGNGRIDPDEFCDNGVANGSNACCSSICTVVDTDGDQTCDAEDDCPTVYDYLQNCAVPLTLTSGRASASGRLRARGTLSGRIGSFAEITLTVGSSHRTIDFTGCKSNSPPFVLVRCSSADRTLHLKLWRRATIDDWTFRLHATGLPSTTTADGPIRVELIDTANSRMARGELSNCVTTGAHVACGP